MAAHFIILTGESYGQRGLVGYSPWDGKELLTDWQHHDVYPLRGNQDSGPGLHYCFLTAPLYLCISPVPCLAVIWIWSLQLREGPGGWMKTVSSNPEKGGHRKPFVPRSPTRSGLTPWSSTYWMSEWGNSERNLTGEWFANNQSRVFLVSLG